MAKTRAPNKAGLNKKELISRTALSCYMELGPARTTIAEIAKRAKIPAPLVHYYFPTPESLLTEAVQSVLDHVRESLLASVQKVTGDPEQMLGEYMRAHFTWAKANRERFSLWLYFYYEACQNPVFARMNAQVRETGRERIKGMIYEGVAKKRFKLPRGADVNDLALEIQTMINGAWIMPFTDSECDFERVTELTIRRALSILGA